MKVEVKTLRFEGLLRMEDNPDTPFVGDEDPVWRNRDVMGEIQSLAGYRHIECAIQIATSRANAEAEGTLDLDEGSTGYSDWTPGDPARFCVGEKDILDFLWGFDGEHVVIDVALSVPSDEGSA